MSPIATSSSLVHWYARRSCVLALDAPGSPIVLANFQLTPLAGWAGGTAAGGLAEIRDVDQRVSLRGDRIAGVPQHDAGAAGPHGGATRAEGIGDDAEHLTARHRLSGEDVDAHDAAAPRSLPLTVAHDRGLTVGRDDLAVDHVELCEYP